MTTFLAMIDYWFCSGHHFDELEAESNKEFCSARGLCLGCDGKGNCHLARRLRTKCASVFRFGWSILTTQCFSAITTPCCSPSGAAPPLWGQLSGYLKN